MKSNIWHLISISLHTTCVTLMTSIKQDSFHITFIQSYASCHILFYCIAYAVYIWDDLYGLKVSCISMGWIRSHKSHNMSCVSMCWIPTSKNLQLKRDDFRCPHASPFHPSILCNTPLADNHLSLMMFFRCSLMVKKTQLSWSTWPPWPSMLSESMEWLVRRAVNLWKEPKPHVSWADQNLSYCLCLSY